MAALRNILVVLFSILILSQAQAIEPKPKTDVQVEGEVVITQADEDAIKRLLKEFKKHTISSKVILMSMPDPYFNCDAYRDLLGYGWKAVPYVIEQAAQIEAVDAYIGSSLIKDANVKTPEEVFGYNRKRKSEVYDGLLPPFFLEITLRELTSEEMKPKSRIDHGYNEVFRWIEWWQQNQNRFNFLTGQPLIILPPKDEHSLIPQIRTDIKDGLLNIYAVSATYQQIIERAAAEMNIDVFIGEHEYLDFRNTLRMKSVTFEEFLYMAGRNVSMRGFKYRKTEKGYLIGKKNVAKTTVQANKWGEAVEGLRSRWVFPTEPIVAGTSPILTMEIENISSNQIIWNCDSGMTWGLNILGISPPNAMTMPKFRVKVGQGSTPEYPGGRAGPEPQPTDFYKLQPGGRLTLSCALPWVLPKAGQYEVNGIIWRRQSKSEGIKMTCPLLVLNVVAKADNVKKIYWGGADALYGLQLGLGFDLQNRPYHQGELVSFKVYVRNTGDKIVNLVHFGLRGWSPTILDSHGKAVSVTSLAKNGPTQKQNITLKPGEIRPVGLVFLKIDATPDTKWDDETSDPHCYLKQGKYNVHQKYWFEEHVEAHWYGDLTTGELELEVIFEDKKLLLPGSQISIEQTVSEPQFAFAAVCKAVNKSTGEMTELGVIHATQKFKIVELLTPKGPQSGEINIGYKYFDIPGRRERAIKKGERIIWLVSKRKAPAYPEYEGRKALADTTQNRKVVSAPIIMAALRKQGMIVGDFTQEEVERMVEALRKGMPPAKPAEQVEEKHANSKNRFYPKGFDLLEKLYEFTNEENNEDGAIEWLNSLSKEDLIRGTMQVSDYMIKIKESGVKEPGDMPWYAMSGMTSLYFFDTYFKRFPGESPKIFLQMAVDKENNVDFRLGILGIFCDDGDLYSLELKYLDIFSDMLLEIAQNTSNTVDIKKAASTALINQLNYLKTKNRDNENLSQKIDQISQKAKQIRNKLPVIKKTRLTDKPANALDLDTGRRNKLKKTWPEEYEVGWDNDAGGSLFTRNSSVWMWPLTSVNNFDEAVAVSSKRIEAVSDDGFRGFPAKENKYVLIKTSEDNFAVLEIQEYDETDAKIKWQIIKKAKKPDVQVEGEGR